MTKPSSKTVKAALIQWPSYSSYTYNDNAHIFCGMFFFQCRDNVNTSTPALSTHLCLQALENGMTHYEFGATHTNTLQLFLILVKIIIKIRISEYEYSVMMIYSCLSASGFGKKLKIIYHTYSA